MREVYKRFVKTWICFANPWIHESWLQKDSIFALPNESGFVSYRGSQILNVFKRFILWIHFVDWFSKDSFNLFSRIQRILTNPDESLVHRHTLNKPKSLRILGFGFANPYWFQKISFVDSFHRPFLKDLFCGFVSWIRFWKICFVDSFRDNKNSKLLDSFCFGRIHVQIPHP